MADPETDRNGRTFVFVACMNYDNFEMSRRRDIMRKAREGRFDALTYLRRNLGVKRLVLDGRTLIEHGRVVGATNQGKVTACTF